MNIPHTKLSQLSILLILLFNFFIQITHTAQQLSTIIATKTEYSLQQGQSISLYTTTNISINLGSVMNNRNSYSNSKPHSIPPSLYRTNNGIKYSDNEDYDDNWNITVTVKIIQGTANLYFGPKYINNGVDQQHLQKQNNQDQHQIDPNLMKKYMKIHEGINLISQQDIRYHLANEPDIQKLLFSEFHIVVQVSKSAQFSIKYGSPQYQILPLQINHPLAIKSSKRQMTNTVYLLKTNVDQFIIKIDRKRGTNYVKVYECNQANPTCYQQYVKIGNQIEQANQKSSSNILMQRIILLKSQQQSIYKCSMCQLYLSVTPHEAIQTQISVILVLPAFVTQLKQNQILNENIKAGQPRNYKMSVNQQQNVKLIAQVYQGQISITVKSQDQSGVFSPMKYQGVISIQIPKQHKKSKNAFVNYSVQVSALGSKSATYSLVYSSGLYQIYMEDGYPSSHQLKPKQSITLLYQNERPSNQSHMFLSFNLNKPKSLQFLRMKVYAYPVQDKSKTKSKQKQKQKQKIQIKSNAKPSSQLMEQTKSFVIELPGNCSKIQVIFQNQWQQQIELTATIHDEQIVFLPLNHSLTLQIQKNSGINLLISNNQQGFIELTIKKCDQSSPNIAYSLNPQDFSKQIYDYESLGDNERVTKSSIKVKKQGGLYVRISGDGIANSFIQVTAKYIEIDRKKANVANSIKKGLHGEMNYQLITNSKAQIWFQQLQCERECQQNTRYQCYWSTSRSDLFRHMICPGIFMLGNGMSESDRIKTEGYKIQVKPGRDGIVSFKQILSDPIIYMSVKATNDASGVDLIYKDIEIVTISGQIGRMSTQFLFVTIGTVIMIVIILFFIIRRQARLGYEAVSTSENLKKKKKKTKLETIKTIE